MWSRKFYTFISLIVMGLQLSLCWEVLEDRTMASGNQYVTGTRPAKTEDGRSIMAYYITKHFHKPTEVPSLTLILPAEMEKLVDFKEDTEGNMFVVGMCTSTGDRATMGLVDICMFKFSPGVALLAQKQVGYPTTQLKTVTLKESMNVMLLLASITHTYGEGNTQQNLLVVHLDMQTLDVVKTKRLEVSDSTGTPYVYNLVM